MDSISRHQECSNICNVGQVQNIWLTYRSSLEKVGASFSKVACMNSALKLAYFTGILF